MHDPYDDEPYSDYDDYDDSQDYDQGQLNWKKFYFSFDVGAGGALSDWIKNIMDGVFKDDSFKNTSSVPEGLSPVSFPVNSWHPNAGKAASFQYLGSNYAGQPIWKKKYFVHDKLSTDYVLHLQSHAGYFLRQPKYYKGLFDILN